MNEFITRGLEIAALLALGSAYGIIGILVSICAIECIDGWWKKRTGHYLIQPGYASDWLAVIVFFVFVFTWPVVAVVFGVLAFLIVLPEWVLLLLEIVHLIEVLT